jgi:hypothetical protein
VSQSSSRSDKFVGIQISPISFLDEGVEPLLDTLQSRFGVNVLLIGTLSWLGLKVGRRISHKLEGFPDHGVQQPDAMRGGSYIAHHPEFYRNTSITNFQNTDPGMEGVDILEMVIDAAHARSMKVMPEVMEPLFKYADHGSANTVQIPNLPQYLEVDQFGRIGSEPSTSNPHYRTWLHSVLEDYARNYAIDGIMWCNERRSPLDNLIAGNAANDFSPASRREALERNIDVERVLLAYREAHTYFQDARKGRGGGDGYFIEFLRMLLRNPEILIWERFWLERNKDLDRELYGIVKWCNPALSFGLNVWNRNHFNPLRKAQYPWLETTMYCDFVKPITYQHQSGGVYKKEMSEWHQSVLRDFTPQELTPMMYKLLGLNEAPWDELLQTGMNPTTYVGGVAKRAIEGRVPVYMGIGVDAPRSSADQAVCTPEIVEQSVLASYQNGASGIVYSPNYAGMNHSSLDGGSRALKTLGLL